LGPIPNPKSPIPNPQSPLKYNYLKKIIKKIFKIKLKNKYNNIFFF